MLHEQAAIKQIQINEAQASVLQQIMQNASKSILQNVNDKSDAYLVRLFFEEFNSMVNKSKQSNRDLYLLDALQQLHFIDEDISKEPNYNDENYENYRKM